MQVDRPTFERYGREVPALQAAVESSDVAEFVMRRDSQSGLCVKLEAGWCGIHREYGQDFLGDACHFYPRAPRALGDAVVVSGALSCPEMARLALYHEAPFEWSDFGDSRQPYLLKNYLPPTMKVEQALHVHQQFVRLAGDATVSAGHSLMRLSTICRAFEIQPAAQWPELLPIYLELADGRIPAAEPAATDAVHLLHALHGLVEAATVAKPPRLAAIIDRMAQAMGVQFEGMAIATLPDSDAQVLRLLAASREAWLQPILRRYLQAQLSQSLFPFSGFGATLSERITIIGVRMATVKLALATLTSRDALAVVETIQPIARFMDHLADPALSLAMYRETGWTREARLRALINDA